MTDETDDAADRLRIDRWLWCARLFKSRSAAAAAVRGGHVRLNGQRVKPAHAVKIGDALQIDPPRSAERDIAIAAIPARRGPAPEAAATYVESAESIERRRRAAEERAARGVLSAADGRQARQADAALVAAARQRGPLSEP